ncbi:hypothetical protein ACL7TT_15840 [Microbulbifer sp. 2304DJ12-6]|uniref:hypothetical protein n=1 Tax=Microbulbifer sp. 2304DJ12-6 TaxID=3233340 RepID=UPI0039AEE324
MRREFPGLLILAGGLQGCARLFWMKIVHKSLDRTFLFSSDGSFSHHINAMAKFFVLVDVCIIFNPFGQYLFFWWTVLCGIQRSFTRYLPRLTRILGDTKLDKLSKK